MGINVPRLAVPDRFITHTGQIEQMIDVLAPLYNTIIHFDTLHVENSEIGRIHPLLPRV